MTRIFISLDLQRRRLLGGIAGAIVAASAPQAALQLLGQVPLAGEPTPGRDQVALMLKPLFSCHDPAGNPETSTSNGDLGRP